MGDLDLLQASIQGLADGLIDVAGIIKKKEAALQAGVDSVTALLSDADLKAQVGELLVAGFSKVLAQAKLAATTAELGNDIQLVVSEIPVFQKVIAAFTA